MSDRLRQLSGEDYATGALICIHEARREMEDYTGLTRADETLAVAQRLAIMAGAKDVGPLENGRAFPSADADEGHDCPDGDQMAEENPDTKPTCYACEERITHLDGEDGDPKCPNCGENPLPPVGATEECDA